MSFDLSRVFDLFLLGIFGIAAIISTAMGVILNYHWTHYELSRSKITTVRVLYFGVSLLILGIMGALLIAIFT